MNDNGSRTKVLTSWKEIANYLGKGVRTVQRWERELELPVRRAPDHRNIVMAIPEELERWIRNRFRATREFDNLRKMPEGYFGRSAEASTSIRKRAS